MAKPQANLTGESKVKEEEEFGMGCLNASPLDLDKSESSG